MCIRDRAHTEVRDRSHRFRRRRRPGAGSDPDRRYRGRQVIRLQWVGEPEIPTSQAYYVSVEQLPVPFEPGSKDAASAQVQVLYNMRALAVVAPPGAKPDVKPASVHQVNYQPPALPGATEQPPLQDGVAVTPVSIHIQMGIRDRSRTASPSVATSPFR